MRKLVLRPLRFGAATALIICLWGCATYRSDLERARVHYSANEYDKALALLDVLENDIDSLSEAERAQYSYYRGMSHFRLDQKRDARHWPGNAAARELAAQGSLTPDEKKRVEESMTKLNPAYWGEVSSLDEQTGGSAGGGSGGGTDCKVDIDCVQGEFCDAGKCKKTVGNEEDKPHHGDRDEQPAPKKKHHTSDD